MKSNELDPNWCLDRHSDRSGHVPKRPANSGDSSRIEMSTSVEKVLAHFKICKVNEVTIVNGIVLIPLVRCSFRCTLSLYNAFIWTVSVKADQSELNATRTHECPQARRHARTITRP